MAIAPGAVRRLANGPANHDVVGTIPESLGDIQVRFWSSTGFSRRSNAG